jgi:CubicO group peptidase (beta-lactamase class C family)
MTPIDRPWEDPRMRHQPRTRLGRLSVRACALLVVLALVGPIAAAGDAATRIDSLMSRYQELRQFNGSVLVAAGGEVVFEKGYGLANMEWEVPNTPATKFRLGSITKQFTAMLILQLVDEGKLSLDDTLVDALPYYREDTGSRVTLHQLLNHTSGIPSYTGLPGFITEVSRDPYGVQEFVERFCSGDLEFEPGAEFRYNNSGYFLLGAILEQATGKPYAELLRERILDPVGMRSTGYDLSGPILPGRAAGYERTASGFRNADYLDMSLPYAAGSMYSTVGDLYLWDQALHAGELLSDELEEAMFTPGKSDYAYGWGVSKRPVGPEEAERTVIGHGGGINGFSTLIERVVEDRHLVVLLNNTGGTRLGAMSAGILDVLYDREPQEPRESIREVLLGAIGESGVDAAIARYRELREESPDAYDFDEGQLNGLGYGLLAAGDTDAALAIFRLNVEMFPEAWNPHDSLGEALAVAGQKEEAIRSYARSLELNPGNRNAVERLARLTEP